MDKPVQIVDIPDHTTNIQRQAVSMFDNLLDQAIKGELVEAMVVTKNPDGSYTTHFTDEFKNRAERVGGLEMLKHEVMIDYNEEG